MKTYGQILYCPQCGKFYLHHDDENCDFRYYHDEVNGERGWIPSNEKPTKEK